MPPDIKYEYAADVTAAERAIARLERKIEKLENSNKQLHRTSRTGTSRAAQDFQRWATGVISVGAAFTVVSRSIGAALEMNRQFSSEVSQLIQQLNEAELKLQIQSGLTPAQLEGQLPVIGEQLLATPAADLVQGIVISTQLASSGFKQIDIDSGAALKTVLDLQAATNQFGKALENPKETTKAISQLLKGLGIENTADNIRRIGGDFAELFAGMDIQAKDLADLANVASTLTAAGQAPNVQLAAFAAITEVLGGAQAATTLKQLTSLSIAAGGTPKGVAGLKTLGISADQIDLEGETLIDVLDLLGASLKRLKEEGRGVEAQQAIFDIFGTRAGANILSAIAVAPKAREALGIVEGQGFEQAVAIFQQSRFADNMRNRILTQLLERDVGQERTWQEIRDEIKLSLAASAAADPGGMQRAEDIARALELSAAVTVAEGLGVTPGDLPGLDKQLDEMRTQTHILREIRDRTRGIEPQRSTRTINREAQTEGADFSDRFTSTRSN